MGFIYEIIEFLKFPHFFPSPLKSANDSLESARQHGYIVFGPILFKRFGAAMCTD